METKSHFDQFEELKEFLKTKNTRIFCKQLSTIEK